MARLKNAVDIPKHLRGQEQRTQGIKNVIESQTEKLVNHERRQGRDISTDSIRKSVVERAERLDRRGDI